MEEQNNPAASTTYRLVSLGDGDTAQSVLQSNPNVKIVNQKDIGQTPVTYLVMNTNSPQASNANRIDSDTSGQPRQKVIINNSREAMRSTNSPIVTLPPQRKQTKIEATAASILGQSGTSNSKDSAGNSPTNGMRNPRDDARRRQHNEVERRRRDKINTWITKLAKIVPDCENDSNKSSQSKGAILASAYDHILNLQRDNEELVKKINAMPQIPIGATPDEANAIRVGAMEKEIHRLNTELKQAYDDRDDIIEQLKNQGITLATRPEEADSIMDQQRLEEQQMSEAQEIQRRIEEQQMQQQAQQHQHHHHHQQQQLDDSAEYELDKSSSVRITSSSNGVVVIGAGDDYE